jgi:hypothetical protein
MKDEPEFILRPSSFVVRPPSFVIRPPSFIFRPPPFVLFDIFPCCGMIAANPTQEDARA